MGELNRWVFHPKFPESPISIISSESALNLMPEIKDSEDIKKKQKSNQCQRGASVLFLDGIEYESDKNWWNQIRADQGNSISSVGKVEIRIFLG